MTITHQHLISLMRSLIAAGFTRKFVAEYLNNRYVDCQCSAQAAYSFSAQFFEYVRVFG